MASGKVRNRRSSGNSYSSTITTVIFVGLSVLGVWLLTSNTLAPPQSPSRPSTTIPDRTSTKHQPHTEDRSLPQDIPREIPEDTVVLPESGNDASEILETQRDNSGDLDKQEVQVDQDEPKGDQENQENLQSKQSNKDKEKQMASEESADTQTQQEHKTEEVHHTEKKPKVDVKVKETSQDESTETTANLISEADQQKRLEQQQRQENAQVQTQQVKQKTNDEGSTNVLDAPKTLAKKPDDTFPDGDSTGIPKESKESKKSWSTQVDQSEDQKERRQDESSNDQEITPSTHTWQLCNETAGADFIPCLDNEKGIAKIRHRNHYEHRERHCPEQPPTCLVPLPQGYKTSIEWPTSRDKIWYHNVPHTLLAEVKGHQNWVKVTGEFLTFPGGGTQFIHGALHYIDFIQEAVPDIAWGKHTRVILDVGCGVASFGGYLFERDVLAMSFAPKDEHEAQVQFALERGIPAISAVMGTQRLPFPSRVFDIVHCARCRVPWHADGGALLLELNRVLRPGGYFVWSATPVYQTLKEDVEIWQEMSNLTVAMCWELVTIKKDKLNSVGAAIFHKPKSNDCYEQRKKKNPPMCKLDDDPNAAWYVPLQSCMHKVPVAEKERGSQWPEQWPKRVQTPPYWLDKSQMGIYGKPAPDDFASDYEHWTKVVTKSYMSGLGINWSNVRNIMDMKAVYGGFAAALKDLKVWVMNVVNVDEPDTLPIIYERGLFGIYHDWCESFSTYPRTYDLLHADHLFSKLKKRCKLEAILAEVDRIARPGGKLIMRDESNMIGEVENLLKSMHWEVHLTFSKNQEGILSAQKSNWRPQTYAPRS